MDALPAITVVVPSYNQANFIARTIDSLLVQQYPNLEIIVMDGGSTDGTLGVLEKFSGQIQVVSEKDCGQADAVNKGWKQGHGEVLGWLNSDDTHAEGALRKVGFHFQEHPETMWLIGQCGIVDAEGREIRTWVTKYKNWRLRHFSPRALLVENFVSQMGVFLRRSAFEAAGDLDIRLRYTMDYDLWLRLAKQFPPAVVPEVIAYFRMYASTKSMSSFRAQFREDFEVAGRHTQDKQLLFLHRFNNLKIMLVYELMRLVGARR